MAELKEPYYVLGLDPGIASCGFCLIDIANKVIVEMGVHLFKAPQEDKTKVSLAATRRSKRSIRRNNARTKDRLNHCLNILKEAGLVPADATKQWFQPKKGEKPVLKLRAQGLVRLLSKRELAQILYSLCGHRGYIPHGIGTGATDDTEGRQILSAIKKNTEEMESGSYETIGAMLNSKDKSRNKNGKYELCVYNSQIQDEVRTLFTKQQSLGNQYASEQLLADYLTCLTWEKDTSGNDQRSYDQVGRCTYFPEEKRAADADISSEMCRAYEKFGHLVIVRADGTEEPLDKKFIHQYIKTLFSPVALSKNKGCKVRYSDIRKDLDLSGKDLFKSIDQESEKDEVFAPKAWRKLRECGVSIDLLTAMLGNRDLGDAICEALTYASREDSLKRQLEGLGLTHAQINELATKVHFTSKLFNGYGKRSLKALGLLLDAFGEDEIQTLTDAEEASGLLALRLADRSVRTNLLPPFDSYDETCRNPVVLRSMSRMRKIINAIIKQHGVPNEIHIELGRELKQTKHEKDLISKRNKFNESRNKRLAEDAAKYLGCSPGEVPGRIIRKMALREEQSEKDIYTGHAISLEKLLQDDRKYEIDHILPYSRTSIDSPANKVLVAATSNQNKKNRTPYEWMHSGEDNAPDWDEFTARVRTLIKDAKKRNNLLLDNLDDSAEADFLKRNLNDARYMSRAVKNYIESSLNFPEDGQKNHVVAVAGAATAALRRSWGLNFGSAGDKDRNDDRHHAVDAAVIAACSRSTVQKIAKERSAYKKTPKEEHETRMASTQPWPNFAQDVIKRRESVVPTRMVDHGVTGRAYEDTVYRIVTPPDDKKGYTILEAAGKATKKGNVWFKDEHSAQLVDGIAFLRLWLDPAAKKGKGKWYAEPVYYADIPSINNGTYVPKACTRGIARNNWPPVSNEALASKPVILRYGCMFQADDAIARYSSINISTCTLMVSNPINGKTYSTGFPSITSWTNKTRVHVIHEDILGHCFDESIKTPG